MYHFLITLHQAHVWPSRQYLAPRLV